MSIRSPYAESEPQWRGWAASAVKRASMLMLLSALLIALVSPATVAALQAAPAPVLTTGEVDDASLVIIEEYRIAGDTIIDNGTPIPDLHQQVWDRYALLFPAATRPEVDLFVGIDSEASGGTDGALQVSALDSTKRYLALDVSGAVAMNELSRTMIHETAHLLQFRPSALDGDSTTPCDVYTGGEGCPKAGSYLRLWSEQFYPGISGADYPDSEADIAARYTPNSYVSEYAATNPAEDMAEVFAEWMLFDAPTGPSFVSADPHFAWPVTGTQVVDDKLRFFDQFPELVTSRANIRATLGVDPLTIAPEATPTAAPTQPFVPVPVPADQGPTGDEILEQIQANKAAAAAAGAEAAASPTPTAAPAAAATEGVAALAFTGSSTDHGLLLGAALIGVGCMAGAISRRRERC